MNFKELNRPGAITASPKRRVRSAAPAFYGTRGKSIQIKTAKLLQQRSYTAGKLTRNSLDFRGSFNSINQDIKEGKQRVDARAIELAENNDYVQSYLLRRKNNIVGYTGFKLQVKAKFPDGTFDDFANQFIEDKFAEWCRREYCTMTKRLSMVRVQWLVDRSLALTGEFLVQKVLNLDTEINPFAFSLNVLDPSDIDITYTDELRNGNVVVNGVEVNEWKEIVAIWLRKRTLKQLLTGARSYGGDRQRIDASELYYDFDPLHPKQTRGMTPLAAVMRTLKDIDRFDEYSLVNAGASAAKMGFLKKISEDANDYVGKSVRTIIDDNGNEVTVEEVGGSEGGKYADFEPGIIEELPYGYEFQGYDPKFPSDQHEPFQRLNLRKSFTALGQNYNLSTGDLVNISFSAGRLGVNEERMNFKADQTFIAEAFLVPVYQDWLQWSLSSGALAPLSYANKQKYLNHHWQGVRWIAIDPVKDITADILAVKHGFKTNQSVAEEMGYDLDDNYATLERETKLQEKHGLTLGGSVKTKITADDSKEVGDEQADEDSNKSDTSIHLRIA